MPPTPVARQTPFGRKVDDGFSTLITLEDDPDISLWEKTVTPPGQDGGDAIETTTMHNDEWRTFSPRQLKTLTDASATCAYDPKVFNQLLTQINNNQSVTVTYPNSDTLAFFGYLRSVEPDENTEGEQPTMTVTFTPTNIDPDTGAEADPVFTIAGGT